MRLRTAHQAISCAARQAQVIACGAFLAVLMHSAAAAAPNSARRAYDLPGLPLGEMVRAVCRAAGLNVLFDPNLAVGRIAPRLSGPLTVEEALSSILSPAGLTFEWIGDHSILVRRIRAPSAKAPPNTLASRLRSLAVRAAPPDSVVLAPFVTNLDVVLVTATRRPEAVDRVPLSVTVLGQRQMEQQGLKTMFDVARAVPSLTFRNTGLASQGQQIAIRGIASNYGAPTTGIYIDDVPIAKRGFIGTFSGNGSPVPPLFDLERIEVLRGPQGTLFGSGSEGGTVRFITPSPSFARYSAAAQTEVSTTKGGDPSYEAGAAVGGPIAADKLAFRAAFFERKIGGYIDHVSMYDGHEFGKNTNSGEQRSFRLALAWRPTPRLTITPTVMSSFDVHHDGEQFIEDVPAYTLNSGVFTNAGTVNGIPFDFPDATFTGGSFGPFNQYGPYKTNVGYYRSESNVELQRSVTKNSARIASLTFDYNFDKMNVKLITSIVEDATKGQQPGGGTRSPIICPTTCAGFVLPGTNTPVPGGTGAMFFVPGFPQTYRLSFYLNRRKALAQELRFSSDNPDSPLSWVGGIYYNRSKLFSQLIDPSNENELVSFLHAGVPIEYFLGAQFVGYADGAALSRGDLFALRWAWFRETELAAFGELNYNVTRKLKLIAGLRVTRNEVTYTNWQTGSIFGAPPTFYEGAADPINRPSVDHPFPDQPGVDFFTRDTGTQIESPIAPKLGASYQINENDMVYVTMAKGFRPGGVNTRPYVNSCAAELSQVGVSTLTYTSDAVTSYEAGAKVRVFDNHLQMNGSVFLIRWKNPQVSRRFQCGYNFVINAGAAESKGFDLQTEARLWGGLSLSGGVAYTDAKYLETVYNVSATGAPTIALNKGDELGSPKWQLWVSAQYDFLVGKAPAHVRAGYHASSGYQRGVGPGAVGYDPITAYGAPTDFADASVGIRLRRWDLSLFVKNLTNSQDRLTATHGSTTPVIGTSTFWPREIGIQGVFRY